jgi:glycogen debranching enzyme
VSTASALSSPAAVSRWHRRATSVVSAERGLGRTFARPLEDLGWARLLEAAGARRSDVGAGAPVPISLVARDCLLAAWMLLPVDRGLALGTLRALARHQGRRLRPVAQGRSGKQPGGQDGGRIPEGITLGPGGTRRPRFRGAGRVDATALFVMLLAETRRWGASWDEVAPLIQHADRALAWITLGDVDADGLVECPGDRVARAEVQGYVYAAFRARAALAREAGDEPRAQTWDDAAAGLRHRFNQAFWLPGTRELAVGLDAAKQPIRVSAAATGHCLWTGILAQDRAGALAERLMSPEMLTGWGIRSLASTAQAYDPTSENRGAVRTQQNALIADGLARYGFDDEALRVVEAQLAAADAFGGRLPEAFAVLDAGDGTPRPVHLAARALRASPSVAPFLLLRTMLRLDPDIPNGLLHLAPRVPARYLPLRVEDVHLGDQTATICVKPSPAGVTFEVTGLPAGVAMTTHPVAPAA